MGNVKLMVTTFVLFSELLWLLICSLGTPLFFLVSVGVGLTGLDYFNWPGLSVLGCPCVLLKHMQTTTRSFAETTTTTTLFPVIKEGDYVKWGLQIVKRNVSSMIC